MSAGHERKEKICLNCNARVFGSYCHVCGQHNIEPKETAWGLIVHFFNDITHFEGKFITSLRYLLFKPGFLTSEYARGRRASYMNPVRMYVFASAFFFILFFSFFSGNGEGIIKFNNRPDSATAKKPKVRMSNPELLKEALEEADDKKDSAEAYMIFGTEKDRERIAKDTTLPKRVTGIAGITGKKFKTIAAYDSAQTLLPESERDNWFERAVERRIILVDQKYNGDLNKFNAAVFDYALHSLPKLLFISLPIFAFFLYLLYVRHSKFYYVTHVIFTIHYYVFLFLMLLLVFVNIKIGNIAAWWPVNLIGIASWVYMFIYLYKAMRRVYEQRRAKTVFKYCILLFILVIFYAIMTTALFSYSLFKV